MLRTTASLVLSRGRQLDDDADPSTAARGARRRCGQSGTAERRHRADAPRSAFSSAALTGGANTRRCWSRPHAPGRTSASNLTNPRRRAGLADVVKQSRRGLGLRGREPRAKGRTRSPGRSSSLPPERPHDLPHPAIDLVGGPRVARRDHQAATCRRAARVRGRGRSARRRLRHGPARSVCSAAHPPISPARPDRPCCCCSLAALGPSDRDAHQVVVPCLGPESTAARSRCGRARCGLKSPNRCGSPAQCSVSEMGVAPTIQEVAGRPESAHA